MNRRLLIGLALLVVVAISAGATIVHGWYRQVVVSANPTPASSVPTPTPDPLQPYAYVLLGYAGGNHDGASLTDTIMVVHINPKTHQIHLISLPRDLWVSLPTATTQESYWKINAAYAIGNDDRQYPHKPPPYTGESGGGELAKATVSKVVGMPISKFVAVNFSGFEDIIDAVGGVDVNVERAFEDPLYPITGKEQDTCGKSPEEMVASATFSAEQAEKEFGCRYEILNFERGVTHMDGVTALKFVRSRHSAQDGSDFARATRQRNLLVAVKEKVLDIKFLPRLVPLIPKLVTYLKTDIDLSDTQGLLAKKDELAAYEIKTIAITDQNVLHQTRSSNGQLILTPKAGIDQWSSVHEWLQAQLASSSATVSP